MLIPLALLVLLVPADGHPRASNSITTIVNGAMTYSASQSVHIWRGEAAQMEVFGAVVSTAVGVDVLLADGSTPAPLMVATIATRKPSSVVLSLDVAAPVTRASYIVRFRYAAAAGTPDQFTVRVYDRGTISSIAASTATPGVGESVTITATGQRLDKARPDLAQIGLSASQYSVVSRSSTSLSFTLKFGSVGMTTIHSTHFFDEDIGANQGNIAAFFLGGASRTVEVFPNPLVSSLSPLVVGEAAQVTITGSHLNPAGWTPEIALDPPLPVTVVSATSVRFTPTAAVNGQELVLRYRRDGGAGLVQVKLPQMVFVQLPPIIARAGEVLAGSGPGDCPAQPPCPGGTDTRIFALKSGATHEIQGLWLAPAPGTPVVAKHGSTTLNVTYTDNNRLRFTLPAGALVSSANITVQTGGGTTTSPRPAYFTPPASGLSLQRKDGPETGTYPYVAVTDGKLEPNRTYRVVGQNLHFLPAGLNNGTAYNAVAPVVRAAGSAAFITNAGDGWTSFFVPASQPLGAITLAYEHWGGSTTIGTFQIVAPAAVISSLRVEDAYSSTAWYSGGAVQGTTADRTIQSGTTKSVRVTAWDLSNGGVLPMLTVTSSDAAVIVGGPYTFNPATLEWDPNAAFPTRPVLSVPLQVQPVAAARTVTLTFRGGNNPGAIATVPVSLAPVALPKLESVAFEPAALTGGQHAKARLILASTPPVAMTLPVSAKEPVVQIPSSVTLSAKETLIQLPTPVVTVPTTVEVTVGTGADSRKASLVLHPIIQVQSIVPRTSPIPAGRVTEGALTLNAPAWESTTVHLTSSNPAVMTVPSSVSLRAGQSSIAVPLTAAAGVSTVVSVNVEARIGQQVHVATIRVAPATK